MKHICILAVAGLLMGGAIPAQAAFIEKNYNMSSQSFDFNHGFNVDQFNSALGTLTGVVFTLTGTMSGDIGLENTAASPNIITVTRPADVQLIRNLDSYVILTLAPEIGINDANMPVYDSALDYGGTSGMTQPDTDNPSTSASFTDSGFLSSFIGGGTLVIRLTGELGALNVLGETGKDAEGISANEEYVALLTVGYQYQAIPEPATWALLGLGALACMRKKEWRRRA